MVEPMVGNLQSAAPLPVGGTSAVQPLARAVEWTEAADGTPRRVGRAGARHLFHPFVDFLLVGGASAALLLPAWLLRDAGREAILPALASLAIVLVTLVNYPHFAHSYQLLYEGFGSRVFGAGVPPKRRLRYAWAGIIAPAAIAAALLGACGWGGAPALGHGANAMLFLVGWHYVKQGYGVLLVLSSRLGAGFGESERTWLKGNGYAVWIYSWMALNRGAHEGTLLGVTVRTLDVPDGLIFAAGAAAITTTIVVAGVLVRRVALRRRPVSVNGLVGYLCALYLWVVARYTDPVFALLVPVFHSLQYLPFVWRCQLDKVARTDASGLSKVAARQLAAFVVAGIALGWLGFVGFPDLLQQTIAPDPEVFGPSVCAFLFFVWINIHHYFIDNVIWRRDDETVRRLLAAS
jgi:hypothetical protein